MKEKISLISILVNIFLTISKVVIGFISDSTSVLAEGVHSLMDIFSSTVSYVGIKIAQKPADQKYPYGYWKFEVMAGFFITLILLLTGGWIIYESYQKFINPGLIKIQFLAFLIMIFSAIVNEVMARLKIHFGKKENSIALLSDGFHSRIDVFTSLVVFIGLFLTKYWLYIDSILAFLIGLYIIKDSFSLGKEAVDSLLDISAGPEIEKKIREIVEKENIKIDSLKTQKKGSVITVNLEIILPKDLNVGDATKISDNLRKELMEEIKNISYIAIQIKSHDIESKFYKPFFGRGYGWQQAGKFKIESKDSFGRGPGGFCVCQKCDYKILHKHGIPCSTILCLNCKVKLERR